MHDETKSFESLAFVLFCRIILKKQPLKTDLYFIFKKAAHYYLPKQIAQCGYITF